MNSELRLISHDNVEFVARLVYAGDLYGADGRTVNHERTTLVEFARSRLGGDRFVAVMPAEALTAGDDWRRHGIRLDGVALPLRQVDLLRRWIVSPATVEDAVAVFVGDSDELDKARVALSPLQFDAFRERGGAAAVARVRRLPPRVVIVGDGVQGLEALDVVRRIARATETRDVPVVVIGGDEAAAKEAGAALHVAMPPDYRALVSAVADLIDLL